MSRHKLDILFTSLRYDRQNPDMVPAVSLDTEMVRHRNGKHVAARVVIAKKDDFDVNVKIVLDLYVRYGEGEICNYLTRYSHIQPSQLLNYGMPLAIVKRRVLQELRGCVLVTFNGLCDFRALGLSIQDITSNVIGWVELQKYFKRSDGSAYGLGPLTLYFGYKRFGKQVIINHDCIDDAYFTLRLFLDFWRSDTPFVPVQPIPNGKQYRAIFGLQ